MAFRLSGRVLQQVVKKSTGLTGLDVVPNAREVLVKLYEKTLKDVQVSRPPAGGRGRVSARVVTATPACGVVALRPAGRSTGGWLHAATRARSSLITSLSPPRLPATAAPQIMPSEVPYRKAVEAFTTFRMNVVKENADVSSWAPGREGERMVWRPATTQRLTPSARRRRPPLPPPPVAPSAQVAEIERIIGCGQVEQLIEQAKGELILIPEYASWKVWEAKPASPDDDDFAVSSSATPRHPRTTHCPAARCSAATHPVAGRGLKVPPAL
jgi:hypothetical protein